MNFDFEKLLRDADKVSREDVIRDAVGDEIQGVMAEVAPRVSSVLQEQMRKDPTSTIHINAVFNAALYATLSWVVACTPETEEANDTLRESVSKQLDMAIKNARPAASEMASIAYSAGKLKLMEDALEGLASVLTSNSMILKGIHDYLKGK